MSHLKEVRDLGHGRSHWIAAGPVGLPVEWDAEITELAPTEIMAWRSVPGSVVVNAGRIRFHPAPDGGTRLDIRISHQPPAGAVGHVIARLLGSDPKRAVADGLARPACAAKP